MAYKTRSAQRTTLRYGGTEYVLAKLGDSYIANASRPTANIGLRSMVSGLYDFFWLDTVSGASVRQHNIPVADGNQLWRKPTTIDSEVAVYITRIAPVGPPAWPHSK
jgi:hypothetical protein